MINQVSRQSDLSQKRKAFASFVLGILSAISIIARELILPSLRLSPQLPSFLQTILFIVFFIMPLASIVGVILGILGLKSAKRNFAIAGIVLCAIGLLVPLYYFLSY